MRVRVLVLLGLLGADRLAEVDAVFFLDGSHRVVVATFADGLTLGVCRSDAARHVGLRVVGCFPVAICAQIIRRGHRIDCARLDQVSVLLVLQRIVLRLGPPVISENHGLVARRSRTREVRVRIFEFAIKVIELQHEVLRLVVIKELCRLQVDGHIVLILDMLNMLQIMNDLHLVDGILEHHGRIRPELWIVDVQSQNAHHCDSVQKVLVDLLHQCAVEPMLTAVPSFQARVQGKLFVLNLLACVQ